MKFKDAWNRFWFTPASPAPLSLFRIFYGVLVLATGILLAPDLFTWFGAHPVISQQAVHDWEHSEARFSIFFLLPDSNATAVAMFLLLMVSATTLTLGLFTRLSAILLFISLCSFDQRMACIFNAGDTVLRHQAFLLMFSDAGALFSLDRLRNRSGKQLSDEAIVSSPWAQRLIQFQIAAVYSQTFFSKIICPQWTDGTALYYCSRLTDFARLPILSVFDNLLVFQLLSWMTIAVECALFTLIWWKKTRYAVLLAGIIFHMGIDLSMNIPIFEYVMIATYITFLEPKDIFKFIHKIENAFAGRRSASASQLK